MFHHEYKKSKSFPYLIFRLMLSFCMLVILSLGVYQAFKYFSGTDPIKISPQAIIVSSISNLGNLRDLRNLKDVRSLDDVLVIARTYYSVILGTNEERTPESKKDKILDSKTRQNDRMTKNVILKFAVVSDSHEDNNNLENALNLASDKGAKFVIGLGDYTKTGGVSELQAAKAVFQKSSLPFYLTPGDHDLWEAREKGLPASQYFSQVFSSAYQSFSDSNIRFVIVYNSDNYLGIEPLQKKWLEDELARIKESKPKQVFVFMHEPLYHPTSDHVMGKGDLEKGNPEVAKQAEELLNMFKEIGVGGIFAGDTHFYTRYEHPKLGLKMTAIGAVTKEPNTQKPRFIMVDVFEDGSYNVEDLEIK